MGRVSDKVLSDLRRCPFCRITRPAMVRVWTSDGPTDRSDGGKPRAWSAFMCTSCGSICSAEGFNDSNQASIRNVYPSDWSPSDRIPESASRYLQQAHDTLHAPDASVVMSASAIDSMLKSLDLSEGALHKRIEEAVSKGYLTKEMSRWAHNVRLNSNNPRHADIGKPHLTQEEAHNALAFGRAIAEILFVLPSRIPETRKE